MNVEWLSGWYATRLHALPENSPPPTILRGNKSLCGAWVYTFAHPLGANRKLDKEVPRCKHCMRLVEQAAQVVL